MTRKLTAIIVDDEDLARMVIREHLAVYANVSVTAECSNGFDAVKQIARHEPQLVFLDIQMPKLNGFEVLEEIEMIEVKQGPYAGEKDKTRFKGNDGEKIIIK